MIDLSLKLHDVLTEAHRRAVHAQHAVLASLSIPIPTQDIIQLFAALDDGNTTCVLWQSDAPSTSLLGWECALDLTTNSPDCFTHIDARWRTWLSSAVIRGPLGPRLVGGFRFDGHRAGAEHWQNFPNASMILAKLLIVQEYASSWAICQHIVQPQDNPDSLLQTCLQRFDRVLQAETRAITRRPPKLQDTDCLPAEQWQDIVKQTVYAIERAEAEKIVLARDVRQTYDRPLQPSKILQRLRSANPNAHLFAVKKAGRCFLGASPERLIRVAGGEVNTQALAGTTNRSRDRALDHELGMALLASAKNRAEHAYVVEAIRASLSPFTEALNIPDVPSLAKLSHLQHLNTPITAQLKAGNSILKLVKALHPTPAVAGHPRCAAMTYIRKYEGFDRGWYAAPIGWMDSDGNGDFAVALRSALISATDCHLFAGCGIVRDSDPKCEYDETLLKMVGMQAAIESAHNNDCASY